MAPGCLSRAVIVGQQKNRWDRSSNRGVWFERKEVNNHFYFRNVCRKCVSDWRPNWECNRTLWRLSEEKKNRKYLWSSDTVIFGRNFLTPQKGILAPDTSGAGPLTEATGALQYVQRNQGVCAKSKHSFNSPGQCERSPSGKGQDFWHPNGIAWWDSGMTEQWIDGQYE